MVSTAWDDTIWLPAVSLTNIMRMAGLRALLQCVQPGLTSPTQASDNQESVATATELVPLIHGILL